MPENAAFRYTSREKNGLASARANIALAEAMTEFVNELGFDKDNKTRTVVFNLQRPYQDPTTKAWKMENITVTCPLLGLVPIPALLVQNVTIDLTVSIDQQSAQKNSSTTEADLSVGANWGWGSASFTGKYSTTSENTRSSDYSAKYTVNVVAQQQPATEGMSKLMDVMASVITPLPTQSS